MYIDINSWKTMIEQAGAFSEIFSQLIFGEYVYPCNMPVENRTMKTQLELHLYFD